MTNKQTEEVKKVFEAQPIVKLVYLFGSRAQKSGCPLSDYDFAVYLDENIPLERSKIKLEILGELSDALKTDKVDMVVLNDTEAPELKYAVIAEGKLIYEVEPHKVLVEPHIMSEYFDFRQSLVRYGLSKPNKKEQHYVRET